MDRDVVDEVEWGRGMSFVAEIVVKGGLVCLGRAG